MYRGIAVEQTATLRGGVFDGERHTVMSDWNLLELPSANGQLVYARMDEDRRKNAEVIFAVSSPNDA